MRAKGAKLPRGIWGHVRPGKFKIEHSETLFQVFLESQYPGKAGVHTDYLKRASKKIYVISLIIQSELIKKGIIMQGKIELAKSNTKGTWRLINDV